MPYDKRVHGSHGGRPLKILMIDKYYYVKGGPERYLFELKKIFEAQGHEVIPFSMADDKNEISEYQQYFVKFLDFLPESKLKQILHGPQMAGRMIYSLHAKRQLEKLLRAVKPDIAHLHMIDHQISPSILHTLKRHRIPMIQSVHQYKLLCPNYRFYIEHKQEICERCLGGNFIHAALQRCHKHSFLGSSLVAFESAVHRLMKIYDLIDLFHVPSQFMGKKLIEGGVDPARVVHQFLTLDMTAYPYSEGFDNYFLYYGRLSDEKGILTLLKAIEAQTIETPCYIVGDGPSRPALENYARDRGLHQIRFWGYQSGQALIDLIARAMFVVVPSEWYENSPLVIYEPFALGTPVIGADIGGIPEFIQPGKTGYIFESGNVEALGKVLRQSLRQPETLLEMGKAARAFAIRNFNSQGHSDRMLSLYDQCMKKYASGATLE